MDILSGFGIMMMAVLTIMLLLAVLARKRVEIEDNCDDLLDLDEVEDGKPAPDDTQVLMRINTIKQQFKDE